MYDVIVQNDLLSFKIIAYNKKEIQILGRNMTFISPR